MELAKKQGCLYEVFIFPMTFKSVSFHHRANYFLKVFSTDSRLIKSVLIQPQLNFPKREVDSSTGNIQGVGSTMSEGGVLTTERFPIEYNEQSVKFTTGMWFQTLVSGEEIIPIVIELYRVDVDKIVDGTVVLIPNPQEKKVSEQILYLNLSSSQESNQKALSCRKLILPTVEYISFIDLSCVLTKLGRNIDLSRIQYDGENTIEQRYMMGCCLVRKVRVDGETFLRELYQIAVKEKLSIYASTASFLKLVIRQYYKRKKIRKHSLKTNKRFEKRWVNSVVPDLSHVAVEEGNIGKEEILKSCVPLNNEGSQDLSYALCQRFNCELVHLASHIASESWLIQKNIQAVFQRIIQIVSALADGGTAEIAWNEKNRVKSFLALNNEEFGLTTQYSIPASYYQEYKLKLNDYLSRISNYSILEKRQPLIITSGEHKYGAELQIDRTATILVHGFRGSEFDLSKVKSYLNLFLGFSHFYAIKGLNKGDGIDASISKLGQIAAEEVNNYLRNNPMIKYVNVIGFSLGGVIARAMLKDLVHHQDKFNLLMTLASPHLGIKQIESCLVRFGLCYMRKVAKIQSIQDLNNQHTSNRPRYLLELANCRLINSFKWVILVGSHQDDYVPIYSSLCNYSGADEQTNMLSDNFNQQREGDVIRCSVRLQIEESILDKITRRRTHLSLLEDDSFIRMLVVKFEHYFTHTK